MCVKVNCIKSLLENKEAILKDFNLETVAKRTTYLIPEAVL